MDTGVSELEPKDQMRIALFWIRLCGTHLWFFYLVQLYVDTVLLEEGPV